MLLESQFVLEHMDLVLQNANTIVALEFDLYKRHFGIAQGAHRVALLPLQMLDVLFPVHLLQTVHVLTDQPFFLAFLLMLEHF